ncbi:MAG: hypothetical protein RMM98_13865 [Acidobacteriota bacterium]|nr:hypothetical protein [Blastocatellia bacterium]MDW8240691.1 hypothetical protein [Acidobacteriota bacterium]
MVTTTKSRRLDQPTMTLEPDPVIEAYKKDVDRTLIRENLKLSVQQRIENLMKLQEFVEELRRAGRKLKEP